MRPSTASSHARPSRAPKAAHSDNIRVFCRVRPLSREEASKPTTRDVCVTFPERLDENVSLSCTTSPSAGLSAGAITTGVNPNDVHNFTFSRVLRPVASQDDVYTDAGLPSVKDVMAGYNSTVFVYGQTGSGKTHTMFGRVHHHSGSRAPALSRLVKRKSSTSVNGMAVLGGGGGDGGAGLSTTSGVNFFALRAAESLEPDEEVFSPALPTFSHDEGDSKPSFSGERRESTDSGGTAASTSAAIPTSASDEFSGIVPRAVREIFTHIYSAPVTTEFEIRIFFVEVYMEQVRDLLSPEGTKTKLQVREDVVGKRFYVEDCEMPCVTSPSDIMTLVQAGLKRRATSATAMNETSSRSHCILNITVKRTDRKQHESRVGKLFLVDLAGSEKVSKTQSSGMRLEEAKLINRSLTSLSQVIASLSEGQRHVPYRDSVLTKILKDSLGGNARTSLIICCSPSTYNAAETLSTLRFGARAKTIKNRAIVNRQYSIEELETMLRVARQEIAELQKRLIHQQQQHPQSSSSSAGTQAQVKASLSSGSAASAGGGVGSHGPDGQSPPHAVRRLDAVGGDDSTDADTDAQGRAGGGHALFDDKDEEDSGELVMVSLRQRSRDKMKLNDLLAEMGMLKDAIRAADEANGALSEERDVLRQRTTCLTEECALWEANYQEQRQRLAQSRNAVRARDDTIATQQKEICTLIQQMEDWLEPLRVATAAVEDITGEQRFDKSVPRPRRRTLIALESPQTQNMTARLPSCDKSEEVVLFPSGHNSLLASLPASPTAAARASAEMPHEYPLSPSARSNQAILERVAATLSARAGSIDSAGGQPSPDGVAAVLSRSPPPTTSPRMPTLPVASSVGSDRALALTPSAGGGPDAITGPRHEEAKSEDGDDGGLTEAAAARIVELERELTVTQQQFDAVRQSYASATLELQLSQKKLLIRQNRIESLKMSLQQECDTNRELRQTIEKEHKGLRNLVQVARNDANYWRRRYEEVCASTGTPVATALDTSTPPPERGASPVPEGLLGHGQDRGFSSAGATPPVRGPSGTPSSMPREVSEKQSKGLHLFKSIFGGQRQ